MPFKKGGPGRKVGAKNKTKPDLKIIMSMHEQFVSSVKTGSHYVYGHYDETGRCFYIGMGKANRAWVTNKGCRNEKWQQEADRIGMNHVVRIIACNLSEPEAASIERALIQTISPVTNLQYCTLGVCQA